MAKKIYKETQGYNDSFVMVALVMATIGLLVSASSYFWSPHGTIIYSVVSLALAASVVYAIWWLRRLELKVKVTSKNIKVDLEGARCPSRKIAWKNVVNCELIESAPFSSWNGRSLHLGFENQYSLSGNRGLLIETRDGKMYFFGCQNTENLKQAFRKKFNGEVLKVA